MADGPVDDGQPCSGCEEQRAEIERLRAQVARLEAENAALQRAAANRNYERPPHYE